MSRALIVASCLQLLASAAFGQPQAQISVSGGRAGPGDTEGWASYASGRAEHISWQGLMVGGDAALVFGRTGARPRYPRGERFRMFIGSVDGGVHVLPTALVRDTRVEPFVSAGVSLVTDPDCCGPGFGWNVGAGAVVWVKHRVGIRVTGRLIRAFGGEGGLVMVGAGLTFRTRKR